MSFKIIRNDITKMKTEAIVNTANKQVEVGAGCDMAIYKAAGYDELLEYRRDKIGVVEEGKAFLTPAFNLDSKYIIHVVSPVYIDGEHDEGKKLRACYQNALRLAKKNGLKSIAFPLVSTGSFGYPKEEGMRIAIDEINAFLLHNTMNILLVVFDEKATRLGTKLFPDLENYIDSNYIEQRASLAARPSIQYDEKIEERAPRMERCYAREEACEEFEIEKYEKGLEERISHLSDTFSEYLLFLIEQKNMKNTDVWKRAIVDKKVFSKIKNNSNYHPNKLTALCLCVGAMLNLDETKDLLARAGYALSPCDKTDIIFSYFIENKIYDMIEIDIQLEEHGIPCIIS